MYSKRMKPNHSWFLTEDLAGSIIWILSTVPWIQEDILHYWGAAELTCVCTHTGQHPAAGKTKSNILLHWQAKYACVCVCVCVCVCSKSHSLATEEEVVIVTLIAGFVLPCQPASPSPPSPCSSQRPSQWWLMFPSCEYAHLHSHSFCLLFGRISLSLTHTHTSHLSIHKVSVSHRSMCHRAEQEFTSSIYGENPSKFTAFQWVWK